jgi:GT2 family glycosyltransferase
MNTEDIAAIIVHHRSYETLGGTIASLIAQGIQPSKLLVVDNSEEPARQMELRSLLPDSVELAVCPNSGYGAAVNYGVAWHSEQTKDAKYLLVSTHEALPEDGALLRLRHSLDMNPSAGVVGPALVTGDDSEIVWSVGGYFSSILGLPRHIAHQSPRSELDGERSRKVSWLDGAFLLFRRAVIETHRIDEDFFLYMEEVDHHQELQRHGWDVIVVPEAVVWQSSGGIPAYYHTRNIQLFQAKNGTSIQRVFSAPYILIRTIARDLVKRHRRPGWSQLFAGWLAGMTMGPTHVSSLSPRIFIVNPLGGALAHYTQALAETLRRSGADVEVHTISEPSLSGSGRLRWVSGYLSLLNLAARRSRGFSGARIIVTWPAIGFLDLLAVKFICGDSTSIVYHDPKPLVRAIGGGDKVARMVSMVPDLPQVIVHSQAAAEAMRHIGLGKSLELLAHPMLSPDRRREVHGGAENHRPVVRVLGQFKQDRDIGALHTIASELGSEFLLEIVGRGWPAVQGWSVDSRFVTESELDHLVHSSSAIVVPYKRFYQSGIAIRALEAGTPIVGRSSSSLADLYGSSSKLLVRDDSDGDVTGAEPWSSAVRHAIGFGRAETLSAAGDVFDRTVSDWRQWMFKSTSELNRLWQR